MDPSYMQSFHSILFNFIRTGSKICISVDPPMYSMLPYVYRMISGHYQYGQAYKEGD